MGPWEACFGARIRLGKAVAGPGVRGQECDRDKWTQGFFWTRDLDWRR